MLNEDVDAVKAPISDRIWQHLPRRIEQKYIVVIILILFLWERVCVSIFFYTCFFCEILLFRSVNSLDMLCLLSVYSFPLQKESSPIEINTSSH